MPNFKEGVDHLQMWSVWLQKGMAHTATLASTYGATLNLHTSMVRRLIYNILNHNSL